MTAATANARTSKLVRQRGVFTRATAAADCVRVQSRACRSRRQRWGRAMTAANAIGCASGGRKREDVLQLAASMRALTAANISCEGAARRVVQAAARGEACAPMTADIATVHEGRRRERELALRLVASARAVGVASKLTRRSCARRAVLAARGGSGGGVR